LQLDVVATGKELTPAPRDPFGALGMIRKERRGELAVEEARERDQALGTLLERAAGNDRAATALVLQPGAREERTKPEVSGARSTEKQRAEGLLTIGRVLDPAVGADNGLHAGAASGAVELDHAEEIRGIGQRERRHVVGRGAPDCIVNPDYAVAHRVLAM